MITIGKQRILSNASTIQTLQHVLLVFTNIYEYSIYTRGMQMTI